jgi:hypothetical protein
MPQVSLTADPAEVHAALDASWDQGDDATRALAGLADVGVFPVPDNIRQAFWRWYDAHSEDVILKKRILFWTVELRVKHLRFLFERLFGQHP